MISFRETFSLAVDSVKGVLTILAVKGWSAQLSVQLDALSMIF